MSGAVTNLSDATFDEEIAGADAPVLVDFWAEWCGPCRMIAPAVDELANEYQEKGLKVGKLNVDHNPATSAHFGVRSIPAVLFFKDGELVDQVIGAGPKAMYENKVPEHL